MSKIANIITFSRIVLCIVLLFFPALSYEFYILYLMAGFTDMIDGFVARKTNSCSEFGSVLDTLADFIFVFICIIKLMPVLYFPVWIWIGTGIIALIKLINVIYGFIVYKRFVSVHSIANKITGFLMFVLPLSLPFLDIKYSGGAVCIVAFIAAIQESIFIMRSKSDNIF